MKKILILILLMVGSAQADSESHTAGTAGLGWTNGSYATGAGNNACATYNSTGQTVLNLSNFTFTIPYSAKIDSINLIIDGGGAGSIGSDSNKIQIQLGKTVSAGVGNLVENLILANGGCAFSANTNVLGNGVWGTYWMAAEIDQTSFSVRVQDDNTTAGTLSIDAVTVTVYYTLGLNYETVIHSDINDLAGNFSPACWRPLILTSTNNIYVRFAVDYRQVQGKAYSTNGGSTWTKDSLSIATGAQYTDDDYCFGSNLIADTLYLSLPQNTTLNFLMGKIFGNSLILMDTVFGGTTPAYNSSIFPTMNYNANQMVSLRRTGGALHDFIADSSDGRLAQGVGWSDGSTAADSIEPAGNISTFPILGGVALYAVNGQDLYFHNGSDWFASGTDILPIPDQDNEAMYFLAYSLTDSNFIVTYEENDTVFCIRAKLSGASFAYTAIDTTIVEGGDNWASTDAALECRYPTCSFLGTKLIVFYCTMPDTTKLNNISIVYKISTDYGATFQAVPDTLHRATDADYIQNLNSPPYFNDDANDLICVAWTSGADRLGGDTGWELFFAADSLKIAAGGVYTGQVIIIGGD